MVRIRVLGGLSLEAGEESARKALDAEALRAASARGVEVTRGRRRRCLTDPAALGTAWQGWAG